MVKKFEIGTVSEIATEAGILSMQAPVTVTEETGTRKDEYGNEIPIIKTERFTAVIPVADIPVKDEQAFLKQAVLDAYAQYTFDLNKYKKYEGITFTDG